MERKGTMARKEISNDPLVNLLDKKSKNGRVLDIGGTHIALARDIGELGCIWCEETGAEKCDTYYTPDGATVYIPVINGEHDLEQMLCLPEEYTPYRNWWKSLLVYERSEDGDVRFTSRDDTDKFYHRIHANRDTIELVK